MASGSKPQEVKKLGDEILMAYRVAGTESLGDDSATTIDTPEVGAAISP